MDSTNQPSSLITYELLPLPSGRSSISLIGRLSRKTARPVQLYMPADLKTRLDDLSEGGSQSAILIALLQYALDDIEKKGSRVIFRIG